MATAYVQNTDSVTSEMFDEETVLINFETGVYFSLQGSAPLIWNLLQTPTPLDGILASMVDDPLVGADAIQAMLDHLLAQNCVRTVQIDATRTVRTRDPSYKPYTPPVIQTFHDLEELISVDPVHEVHEIDGWPHRPLPFSLE